jgi:hypothetical protein
MTLQKPETPALRPFPVFAYRSFLSILCPECGPDTDDCWWFGGAGAITMRSQPILTFSLITMGRATASDHRTKSLAAGCVMWEGSERARRMTSDRPQTCRAGLAWIGRRQMPRAMPRRCRISGRNTA